ncbi:MAG: hypothetical protein HN553_02375 [Opitutae bacterium]|jgi:hypothetical protein|nr:hypothetical protein [Opitutae bacterium]MDA8824074.1 hypothetical protein [Opitutales bacterium]
MNLKSKFIFFTGVITLLFLGPFLTAQNVNPFERPGSRKAKPPTVVRPAPQPPAPVSMNPNVELRGMFLFQDEWYFSLHDRSKNKGAWLKIGERFDDGKVEIVGYDEDSEEVKLKGGFSLTLKNASNLVLPVPSGQPIKKTSLSKPQISSPKRPNTQSKNRVPPRISPPRK